MKNKKAFAPIMTLVIILAVGLVAALGYIFYQNMNSSNSSNLSNDKSNAISDSTTNESATVEAPKSCVKVQPEAPAYMIILNKNGPEIPCIKVTKDDVIGVTNKKVKKSILILDRKKLIS